LWEGFVPQDQHQQQGCLHYYPFPRNLGSSVDKLAKGKLPYPALVVRGVGERIGYFQYLAATLYFSPTSTPD
jgi:hypothetical protein